MRRHLISIFAICMTLMLMQCTKTPSDPEDFVPRELTRLEKRLVESDNTFGFRLFKEILTVETDKNVFISPLSVSMALGMTLNGADGETREAMEETLELTGMTTEEINESYQSLIELLTELDPKVLFEIANSIWYRENMSFEDEFIRLCKAYFSALVRGLDFSDPNSAGIINDWVNDNTHGRIEKILDQIDPNIVMFLINAIYFKGTWTYEFDENDTRNDQFYLPDGSTVSCPMMSQENEFQYFDGEDFQTIDLPYGDGLFSMTILLPHMHVHIDSLVLRLDQENWNRWTHSFSTEKAVIYLPKFKLEYELVLNDILKTLGMEIAFAPGADFTRMYKPGGLWIDEVKHKTFVKVDEEGTEAAAVTVVKMVDSALPTMYINRPFLFFIRENHSQTILFAGKIVEPEDG